MLSFAPARSARVARAGPDAPPSELGCRVRLADGRVFTRRAAAARHRALQLGMLHAESDGLVELRPAALAATAPEIDHRQRRDHFLPGGASGQPDWLRRCSSTPSRSSRGRYAARIDPLTRCARRCSSAPRRAPSPRGGKDAVAHTRLLWVDVDRPGQLGRCGRSSPSGRVTCSSSRAARAACTPTGSSPSR